MDHARGPVRRRGRASISSSRKIKAAFERIPGAEVWGEKCAPEDIPQLAHPGDRIQGGVPNLDWNTMTGWYGGEEGGHIGFSLSHR